MRLSYIAVLGGALFLNLVLSGQENSDWKLVKDLDNNIKVYVQQVPASQIKKVKVETVILATLSELVLLFKDAENHHNWFYMNEWSKIVEEIDEFNWRYYGYTDPPWPVSDRDFYTDVTLIQSKVDSSITLTSVTVSEFLPEVEDCVRIPYIHSVWTLIPMKNDSVQVMFELEIDIGGAIPTWLVNLAVTKGPLSTMIGLIEELKTNRYKGVKLDYIKEF